MEPWEVHWKDYYKILQVHTLAEPEVVKAAYDRLARKYHPDINKNPTDSDRMKDINEAYEVLSNPEKKNQYHTTWLQKTATVNVSQQPAIHHPQTIKRRHIHLSFWWLLVFILVITGAILILMNYTPKTETSSLPDVKIQSVLLESVDNTNPEASIYKYVFRVINNESYVVRLYWEMESSITGKSDSGYVTVVEKSYRDIVRSYDFFSEGEEIVTYSLFYNGNLLNTCSTSHTQDIK